MTGAIFTADAKRLREWLFAALIVVGLITASLWLLHIPKSLFELTVSSALNSGQTASSMPETQGALTQAAELSFEFELDAEPQRPIELLVFSDQSLRAIELNRSQLPQASSEQKLTLLPHGTLHVASFAIPRNFLLPGRNTFEVRSDADEPPPQIVSLGLISSNQAVFVHNQAEYWSNTLPKLLVVIGVLLSFLCFCGILLSVRPHSYTALLFLAGTLASAGMISTQPGFLKPGGDSILASAIFHAVCGLVLAASLRLHWTQKDSHSSAELGAWTAAVIWLGLSAFAYITKGYAVSALYIFCVGAGGAVVFACLRVARLLYEDIVTFRAKLQALESTIDKQADELDEKSQLIAQEMQRSAVLEERQRMMRDIHDGIGGQLLSLMLRVRSGSLNVEDTARGIKQSLSDLRLVVDSADHLGGDLMSALSTFRSRAQQQLSAAGIKLEWQSTGDLTGKFQSTSKTLDIYRFMQEAMTNIVRHSDASAAQVNIFYQNGQDRLVVEIHDDGCGLPDDLEGHAGKGLANLAERAKRLEAEHSLERAVHGSGTVVRLSLDPR